MRASGILLPVFSLPSAYGIGDLYREAYKFIDRLSEAGQKYWQVLPIGPVNKELCPYQSSSSFAGEALLISLEKLEEEGLLSEEDVRAVREADGTKKERLQMKREALRLAFDTFSIRLGSNEELGIHYQAFCKMEETWLEDFALYEALTEFFGEGDWSLWDEEIRSRDPQAIAEWTEKLADAIGYYRWTQYEFFRQWDELKKHAHAKSVELIGDIPYYTAYESADCWAFPQLFQLDENGVCEFEAGAPPDAFTAKGQCWGNPVYNWDAVLGQSGVQLGRSQSAGVRLVDPQDPAAAAVLRCGPDRSHERLRILLCDSCRNRRTCRRALGEGSGHGTVQRGQRGSRKPQIHCRGSGISDRGSQGDDGAGRISGHEDPAVRFRHGRRKRVPAGQFRYGQFRDLHRHPRQ